MPSLFFVCYPEFFAEKLTIKWGTIGKMAKSMKRWERVSRGSHRFYIGIGWKIGIDGGKVAAFDFCGGFSGVDGSAPHG